MPTKLDDSQITSTKLDNLVVNVGHIKAPVEEPDRLPSTAEDGERIYVKALKKDFVFDALKQEWVEFKANSPKLEEKVLVFVMPSLSQGVQKVEMKFPFEGTIKEISASCAIPGLTSTSIQVEKCSQSSYNSVPNWENVLSNPLVISENLKSVLITEGINDAVVNKNDYFRLNALNVGTEIEGLTFEILVELLNY